MSTAMRRTAVFLLWPALALAVPGCATSALWREEDPVRRVVLGEHGVDAAIAVTMDPAVEGALQVEVQRDGELALPAASGMADRSSSWRLRPAGGADLAAALLDGLPAFEVDSVEVRAVREVAEGVVTARGAELRIHGRVVGPCLASAVDVAVLPAGLISALTPLAATDAGVDYCVPLDAPELIRECTNRLRAMDLGRWLSGGIDRARVTGYVWLERDHLAALDGARARELVGGFVYSDRSLERRLEALRSLRVLVAAARDGATEFYILRPDLVWLCAALDACGAGAMHSSMWWAEPVAAPPEGEPAAVLARGTMHLDYVTARYDALVAQAAVRKILLTPWTVATDVVAGIAWALIEDPVELLIVTGKLSLGGGR